MNLGHWIPVVPYRRKPYLEPGQVTKIHEYHSFCCTSMVLRQLFKVLSPLLVLLYITMILRVRPWCCGEGLLPGARRGDCSITCPEAVKGIAREWQIEKYRRRRASARHGLGRRERSWARLHWYDQWYPAANHSDLQQARQAVRRKRSQRLHLKGEPERCLDLVDTVRPLAGHSQRTRHVPHGHVAHYRMSST